LCGAFSSVFHNGGWPPLKVKRHLALSAVLAVLTIPVFASSAWPFSKKQLTARAAFLMNAATGAVLFQRKAELGLPPASTTKVVTALVALEHKQLHDHLPVSRSASEVNSLKLGLRPGQTMSVQDLLYSALLYSANDASVVLAEGIGKSVEGFAEMMTQKARQLGAENSHFKNPHGLTAPGHYSTAKDLALIFNHAMKNPEFRTIVQTKWKKVDLFAAGKMKRVKTLPLRNKNRLLWNYKGAIGGKTGYTRAARRCFVGAATRNGVTLVVSVLGSRNLWRDTTRLFEYGFQKIKDTNSSVAFMVQIASFRDEERAKSLRNKIAKGGYKTYVHRFNPHNGDTAYRVRIGPYTQWIQAKKVARTLEHKRGMKPMIFLTSPPTEQVGHNGEHANDVRREKAHLLGK